MKNRHFSLVLIFIAIMSIFIITIEKLISDSNVVAKEKKGTNPNNELSLLTDVNSGVQSELKEIELDIETEELLSKLTELTENGWFLNPEINLMRLSEKTRTSASLISKVLNQKLGLNFNQFLNGIRIEYVVKQMKIKVNNNESIPFIEELYLEAGFNSKSTFNR